MERSHSGTVASYLPSCITGQYTQAARREGRSGSFCAVAGCGMDEARAIFQGHVLGGNNGKHRVRNDCRVPHAGLGSAIRFGASPSTKG